MVGNPKKEASGTKMTFPGEKDPQKRADILAYLQTLSDSPVPLPEVRGRCRRQPVREFGEPSLTPDRL